MKPYSRRPGRFLRSSAVFLVAGTLLFAAGAWPAWIKLNGPLVRPIYASITNQRLTPDGSRVVYRADLDADERFELYASPTDGSGGALLLSAPMLTPEGDVGTDFQIAAGSGRVVYRADAFQDGRTELFSVPLDGSAAPVRLNATPVAGGSVEAFAVSADGLRVAYVADQTTRGVLELYGVPIDRSFPPVRLSGPLVTGGDVESEDFALTADGSRVVYLADQDTDEVVELYSCDGVHTPVKLNGPLIAGGDVGGPGGSRTLEITPDGARVVYLADQDVDEEIELYSVPIDGGASPVRLHPATRFQIAPDAQHVAFENDDTLYTVPVDGSAAAVSFTSTLADRFYGRTYEISSDSTRLVYRVEDAAGDRLYSASIDGSGSPVWLSAPPTAGDVHDFRIDPLGNRVAFRFRPASGSPWLLASLPIDGSAPAVQLNAPGHSQARVGDFAFAGPRVLYLSDEDVPLDFELYSAPADGGAAPARISGPLVADGDVESFQTSTDGSLALYKADQEQDSVSELFAVPGDGSASPVKVNDPLPGGPPAGDVANLYAISPDGSRVVYVADQETDDLFEAFSVPIDASAEPVKLNEGRVSAIAFSPDGTRLVHARITDQAEVFAGPIDGSAPATWLGALPVFEEFRWVTLLVSPDSQRLLYSLVTFSYPQLHYGPVHSVPLDGSQASLQLSGGASTRFAIDSGSARAVYLGGPALYSRPLDGSSPEIMLSGSLVANGRVSEFAITPDAQRVVYRADERTDELFELFSVPIDGSAPALVLNGPAAGSGVSGFAVAADSSRVAFFLETSSGLRLFSRVTDGASAPLELAASSSGTPTTIAISSPGRVVYTDPPTRLLSVPIDGGAAPIELSLAASNDFELSPDGLRVVGHGDELFSVPADGSAAPVSLLPARPVQGFEISADSLAVVVRAGALYRVPIDGSEHAVRINGPLTPGGHVDGFQIAPDSRTVVYRADQELDEVFELFAARMQRSIRTAPRPDRHVTVGL